MWLIISLGKDFPPSYCTFAVPMTWHELTITNKEKSNECIVMKSISINELSVEWVAIMKHLIVLDMRCAYIDSMHDESWTNTILTNISFKENEGMANSDALCSFATEQTSNLESSSSRENPLDKGKEKQNRIEQNKQKKCTSLIMASQIFFF